MGKKIRYGLSPRDPAVARNGGEVGKRVGVGLLRIICLFFALFRGWVVSRLVCMDPLFCCGGLVALSDVKMPIGAVFFRIFRPMALFCRRNAQNHRPSSCQRENE